MQNGAGSIYLRKYLTCSVFEFQNKEFQFAKVKELTASNL
jgi:hypothetical protein